MSGPKSRVVLDARMLDVGLDITKVDKLPLERLDFRVVRLQRSALSDSQRRNGVDVELLGVDKGVR